MWPDSSNSKTATQHHEMRITALASLSDSDWTKKQQGSALRFLERHQTTILASIGGSQRPSSTAGSVASNAVAPTVGRSQNRRRRGRTDTNAQTAFITAVPVSGTTAATAARSAGASQCVIVCTDHRASGALSDPRPLKRGVTKHQAVKLSDLLYSGRHPLSPAAQANLREINTSNIHRKPNKRGSLTQVTCVLTV